LLAAVVLFSCRDTFLDKKKGKKTLKITGSDTDMSLFFDLFLTLKNLKKL
jgi:hypothetical protein